MLSATIVSGYGKRTYLPLDKLGVSISCVGLDGAHYWPVGKVLHGIEAVPLIAGTRREWPCKVDAKDVEEASERHENEGAIPGDR